MSDLTDFLLARIAEDKEAAQAARTTPIQDAVLVAIRTMTTRFVYRFSPTRILAECEAKRRIVALHDDDPNETMSFDPVVHLCISCDETYPCQHARLLALPYADHPEYRPEWRP